MVKILIAESDERLNALITECLIAEGYEVFSCNNGAAALKALENDAYSIILADSGVIGVELLSAGHRTVRSGRRDKPDKIIPAIFITDPDEKVMKKCGYVLGVDDLVIKPFEADELVLRVAAVLCRARVKNGKEIVAGDFRMNKEEYSAYHCDNKIQLTVREFEMLYKMLSHPQKTYTRSQLMNEYGGSASTSRTVDVYIAKIREKVSDCESFEIATVHGLGYKVILKQ